MKTLSTIVAVLFCLNSYALSTITTKSVNGSPLCGGEVVNVLYKVDAPAGPGNVFTAQLSDKTGSFDSPTDIGTFGGVGSGTIVATIPEGSFSGTSYRIRVVSSNPVVIGSPCPNKLKINLPVTDANLTDVTSCKATLNWTAAPGAVSYKVRFKEGNNPYSLGLDVGNVTSYVFTGLNSSTDYTFQVRAVCSTGDKSDWHGRKTTTNPCPVPTGFVIVNIGPTTTQFDWNDADCASHYVLIFREVGSDTWDTLVLSTSHASLTGLASGTDYEAQIATLCNLTPSEFTTSLQWQTNFRLGADEQEETNAVSIFPNPSSGDFDVKFENAAGDAPIEITVENMYGQVVFITKKQFAAGPNDEKISLGNIAAGLYLVKVKSDESVMNAAVVVK